MEKRPSKLLKAHLPDEAANPGFWERMPPGSDG